LPVISILKIGDYFTLLLGVLCCICLMQTLWNGGAAEQVLIRSGGKLFKQVPLNRDLDIQVPGPLGNSLITIKNKQVRIAADPSPRQYCVRQGWLKNAGELAICLPNQVSVELIGSTKKYDSLNY
jgi:hypothetical protein